MNVKNIDTNFQNRVVLMYHDIYNTAPSESGFKDALADDYKIDAKLFELHVKACKGKNVAFTFDDGGVSFLTIAAPILEKYGFRGYFFISTKYIGSSGFLSCDQIKELDSRGHIIGSHTHTHPDSLSKLSKDEIRQEWEESAKVLSSIIGHPIFTAGIPNGNKSKIAIEEANRCGITEVYTSVPTTSVRNIAGNYEVGRFVIRNGFPVEKLKIITDRKYYRSFLYFRYYAISFAKIVLGPLYKIIRTKLK